MVRALYYPAERRISEREYFVVERRRGKRRMDVLHGESAADFGSDASRAAGDGVDWDPESSGAGQKLIIALATDFGEPFEG